MLTLMFILYLRKLNKKHSFTKKIGRWRFLSYKSPLLFLIILFLSLKAFSQEKNLKFGIWKNKSYIGFIHIGQAINDRQISYKLQSEISYKLLIPIQIRSSEKSVFNNGILTYSSINRKVNDREKVNKLLVYSYGAYRLTDGKRFKIVHLDTLKHNLVALYFTLPGLIKQVYCDNHQAVSDVIKLAKNKYMVTMPDDSCNIFHYRDGKCIKVEVNNPLYKVELHPINI